MGDDEDEPCYRVTLALVGDSNAGKSSLMRRFTKDGFERNEVNTVGADFGRHTVHLQGKKVKVLMLDSAGQERFRAITAAYYRRQDGIAVVYSTANADAFTNIPYWIEQIEQYGEQRAVKILIGNMCDLTEDRKVCCG